MHHRLLPALFLLLAFAPAAAPHAQSVPFTRAGVADSFTVRSAALGDTFPVRVHLPAGYAATRRYPVVYSLQRGVFFDRVNLPAWMDSAAAAGAPPAIVVAVPDAELDAFRPDSPRGERYLRFIAEELVPAVEARYAARGAADARLLLGFSAGANVLVDLAVRYPGRFGRVSAVSPGWMFRDDRQGIGARFHDVAIAHVARASSAPGSAFHFVWGDGPSEWERRSREVGAAVIAALRARGASVTDAGLVPGDHGIALVREALAGAMGFLLAEEP